MVKKQKIIHLAQVLPPDERAISEALYEKGWLDYTVTNWTVGRIPFIEKILSLQAALETKRPAPQIDKKHLISLALSDIIPQLMNRVGASNVSGWDIRSLIISQKASQLINSSHTAIICRAQSALIPFRKAHNLGIKTILHHPHAHHEIVQNLLDLEESLYPGICDSTFDKNPSKKERVDKYEEEISLADAILCPSMFSADSVIKYTPEGKNVKVIPYGCTTVDNLDSAPLRDPKLFLIAGNLTARKGVHRVLKVWKQLKAYKTHTLRLVGDMHLTNSFLKDYAGIYEHKPRIPRQQLLNEFQKSAAVILNGLSEGMPNVIAEAMGCGAAVLVSRNSGVTGFVEDYIHGRFYDFGDDDQLSEVLEWALTHPKEIADMGKMSRLLACEWNWGCFKQALQCWIDQIV